MLPANPGYGIIRARCLRGGKWCGVRWCLKYVGMVPHMRIMCANFSGKDMGRWGSFLGGFSFLQGRQDQRLVAALSGITAMGSFRAFSLDATPCDQSCWCCLPHTLRLLKLLPSFALDEDPRMLGKSDGMLMRCTNLTKNAILLH